MKKENSTSRVIAFITKNLLSGLTIGILAASTSAAAIEIDTAGTKTLSIVNNNGPLTVIAGATISGVEGTSLGCDPTVVQNKSGTALALNISFSTAQCGATVYVPGNLTLDIRTIRGDTIISGNAAAFRVLSESGSIQVYETGKATIAASALNGSVDIRSASNSIVAFSANGDITLDEIRGSIFLVGSNSNIFLNHVYLPAGSKNTVTTAKGNFTSSGLAGALISGKTRAGLTGSFFSANGKVKLYRAAAVKTRRWLSNKVLRAGTSPAKIQIRTNKGNITINK